MILERLNKGEIIVADGAMGTMLFEKGLDSGDCPDHLNLTKPDIIESISRLYVKAGAEIIQTNTFGASPAKLSHYGFEDKTEEINKKAVSIAKSAAKEALPKATDIDRKTESKRHVYIAGSCGPTGSILKPHGDAEPEDLYNGFLRQIKALVEEGVDIICVETMTDLQEAALALKAAKSLSPEIPVIATMTFDETPKGFYTIMGVSVKEAAAGLEEAGADIIGSNCGNGMEKMIRIAREFKKHSSLPLIIQSNAGLPETRKGKILYSESPHYFGKKAKDLIKAGVSLIGGCCGTTPEHIRSIRNAVYIAKSK